MMAWLFGLRYVLLALLALLVGLLTWRSARHA